ncbi:helicase-associated domain-containing protein [Paenibacillus sp. PAMC21692]|uniref:helicase-associated domain-containing protein n=1 Tax=Paenibacillus sp. PAMC21692 TaxID=2762320 RepID=UPI00164DC13B|nr:helicase-associated domain-containing protein [Paenibacillus sp. PAMC21692]QNK54630.1 helicase-associated domain-containing protein [Paenibacillus sp. PAMC21692]
MLIQQMMVRLPSEWHRKVIGTPIGELASNLSDGQSAAAIAAAVAKTCEGLPPYAMKVLGAMLLICGPSPMEEEKLTAMLRQHTARPGAEIRSGLARLGEAGIAFAIRKGWGERWWVMPSDAYVPLMNRIYECLPLSEAVPADAEVLPPMDKNGVFQSLPVPYERIFLYGLALLDKLDTGVTAKGLLAKKTIDRLAALFRPIEVALEPFGLQRTHDIHYPMGAALFLEGVHALDLVELRNGEELRLRKKQLHKWLQLHSTTRARQLQDWLISRLTEAAGSDSAICAAIVGQRTRGGGDWGREGLLRQWEARRNGVLQRDFGHGSADLTLESRWPDIWLQLFYDFGWLELGRLMIDGDTGEDLFRWRSEPAPLEGELIVQPSGELIAGPGCPYACRWELEAIAERRGDGELTEYVLTAASIAAALEHGWTRDAISRFLQEAAVMPSLPAALESMLEQWASRACQFEFTQATLLRCGSEDRADWLAAQVQSQPFELQRIGPAVFVVDAAHVSPLRKLLQQAGFPPRKGVSPKWRAPEEESFASIINAEDAEDAEDAEWQPVIPVPGVEGLYVADHASIRRCELASDPVPERLLAADWSSVPQMWSRQLRDYHLSTRKELLQKAITLETSVRIMTNQGMRTFVPERLEGRGGMEWSVAGSWGDNVSDQLVRLTPDMWGEMGIDLPDGITT